MVLGKKASENAIFTDDKKRGRDLLAAAGDTWMSHRLAGLTLQDLCDEPLCICCASNLSTPAGFEECWEQLTEEFCNGLSVWEAQKMHAFVILCNPFEDSEVKLLFNFISAVDKLGYNAPPMCWVPHTVLPGSDEYKPFTVKEHSIVSDVLGLGIDGIIDGEPKGLNLVLAIRSQLNSAAIRAKAFTDIVNDRQEQGEHVMGLKKCINSMLWDWSRIRLARSIPPVDLDLSPGEPKEIGDTHSVGKQLGRGAFGSVFKLIPRQGIRDEGLGLVVKTVSKAGVKDLSDLKSIKRTIDVMHILSSQEHWHPNIVRLHAIYHSVSHVMFVMEDGGPENLYRRLCCRSHPRFQHRRPMAVEVVESLIKQAVTVTQYIHVSVGVCHRDIKPENFIIMDKQDCFLKLADFDLAITYQPGVECKTPCGTMPFSAPEVHLDENYDAQMCDVWSLGVVIIEVLCGCRKVEEVVGLENTSRYASARKIHACFALPDAVNNIIQEHHLAEVGPICSTMSTVLTGMLQVDRELRWSSDWVLEFFNRSQK